MTSRAARLGKVSHTLAVKERALLVLRSWKEGREEDPAWRATMPEGQVHEFNRLIGLMNGVNRLLGIYLIIVRLEIEKLEEQHVWLTSVLLRQVVEQAEPRTVDREQVHLYGR